MLVEFYNVKSLPKIDIQKVVEFWNVKSLLKMETQNNGGIVKREKFAKNGNAKCWWNYQS